MDSMTKTAPRTAAQVAVEAVINDPAAYDEDTKRAVLAFGIAMDVSEFYLNFLRDEIMG